MNLSFTGYQLAILLTLLSKPQMCASYDQLLLNIKSIMLKKSIINIENLLIALTELEKQKLIHSSKDKHIFQLMPDAGDLHLSTLPDIYDSKLSDLQKSITHWRQLTNEQKHNYLGVFVTASFRMIISNMSFLIERKFNNNEISEFTSNTISYSILKALNLHSNESREILIKTVRHSLVQYSDTELLHENKMHTSVQCPPIWTYNTPTPGIYQMSAILAMAEVLRLHETTNLIGLEELSEFNDFIRLIQ